MAEALVLKILGKIGSLVADEAVKSLVEKFKNEVDLQEVKKKIKGIESEFRVMRDFIGRVEGGEHNTSFEKWLEEVRLVAHEVEDIIDEYAYLAGEHHNRSRVEKVFHKIESVSSLHSIADKLKEIETSFQRLTETKTRYGISSPGVSTSTISESQAIPSFLINQEEPIGIGKQKEKLVKWLIDGNSYHSKVAVWGMAGLGKTTLVQNVFDSRVIREHFDCHLWVSVSKKYEISDLLKRIIKEVKSSLDTEKTLDTEKINPSDLIQMVRKSLEGKKYLLILDDVWSRDVWTNFASAFVGTRDGSKIVITTQIEEVATSGGGCALQLDSLGEEEAWELFCRRAFKNEEKSCPEALEEWAKKIVAKCQGLPLALVAIGSLLPDRPKDYREWKRFCEQFNRELDNKENAHELYWVNKVINLSYNYLPSYLKSCFLYCSMFPEDYLFKRKRLTRLWVSEGFISVEGREDQTPEELSEMHLNELIRRSMLQVVERNSFGRVSACRMHDIVRESAVTISRKLEFHKVIDDQGVSRLPERARRLFIHAYNDGILSGVKLASLRTFIVLDVRSNIVKDMFCLPVSRFKYLRVLDLKHFPISHLPDSVTNLFNLHHLDLRDTWISELPKLMGKLKYLQVLDLRDTDIQKLPDGVSKLKNLRHLYFPDRLEFSEELCSLQDLQTLKFHAKKQKSVGWIGSLTQLRCLHIFRLNAAHCAELLPCITKLRSLSNLRITLDDYRNNGFMFEDTDIQLQDLQKLTLQGGISGIVVPSLFRCFGNGLRELNLISSQLDEDPLLSLSYHSSLTSLTLTSAYNGRQLCFKAGWFPHLKILHLWDLRNLNLLEIENEALQSLEELHLQMLDALLVVPDGIKFLTSLKEIVLRNMADEFIERIQLEDRSKVAHVPNIQSSKHGFLTNLALHN